MLAGARLGLGIEQIAQRCNLSHDVVARIVDALSREEFVTAPGATAPVTLGPGLGRIGAAAKSRQRSRTQAVLDRIARQTGESVDLFHLGRSSAIVVDRVCGAFRRHLAYRVGERLPLHCTAAGKALLGIVGASERKHLLAAVHVKYTSATLICATDIEEQVMAGCRVGIAFDNGEFVAGFCGIAIAFEDLEGVPTAVSISAPTHRFRRAAPRIAEQLLHARAELCQQ